MSGYQRVTITIFERGDEVAEVQPRLQPADLIVAIIAEFGDELPYLGQDPSEYQLLRDGTPLVDGLPLGEMAGARLVLAERMPEPPQRATAIAAPLYLREPESGRVFRLAWTPALLGRSDLKLPDEALLAVNLSGLPNSARISRRHARITTPGGQPTIECLADNPIILRHGAAEHTLGRGQQRPLDVNDMIIFEFSQLQLQLIARPEQR
jgi:hypothetical protein